MAGRLLSDLYHHHHRTAIIAPFGTDIDVLILLSKETEELMHSLT